MYLRTVGFEPTPSKRPVLPSVSKAELQNLCNLHTAKKKPAQFRAASALLRALLAATAARLRLLRSRTRRGPRGRHLPRDGGAVVARPRRESAPSLGTHAITTRRLSHRQDASRLLYLHGDVATLRVLRPRRRRVSRSSLFQSRALRSPLIRDDASEK